MGRDTKDVMQIGNVRPSHRLPCRGDLLFPYSITSTYGLPFMPSQEVDLSFSLFF